MGRKPQHPRRPLRAIDLFCGAGGLTEGFRRAGYEITFALDRDRDSCATYRLNNPDVPLEEAPITTLTPAEIADRAGGDIDVVIGGPSCQGFSTAGRRNGWVRPDDDRNKLWSHMLGLVEHLRPGAFLMENVPGLVYWRDGHMGRTILDRFEQLGYKVTMDILLAADFGVPQRRRRLFIVGLLQDAPFQMPSATHMGGWRRDTLSLWEQRRREEGLLRHLSVWDAIGDLPAIEAGKAGTVYPDVRLTPFARMMRAGAEALRDHEAPYLSEDHRLLIEHVPQGGTWRDIPPHLLPHRFRGMRRTDGSNLLGRLDPKLPAYTITTQFNNITGGCFTHPYQDRALSIREGARLQTFPDTYEFVGTITSRRRQIGNAVPPILAQVMARQLAVALLGAAADEFHPEPEPLRPATQLPPPPPTDRRTLARMQRQPRKNTEPEVLLRKHLRGQGLRYQLDKKPVPSLRRRADLVFKKAQVAVFVDGCFWHGCPEHARPTKSHTKWWADKIEANRIRDEETNRLLAAAGWTVVRVWEHEYPAEAANRIVQTVREVTVSRRSSPPTR